MKWEWGPAQQEAFAALKQALSEATVLAYPDFRKPFVLHTDASAYGLGAVLSPRDEEGHERVLRQQDIGEC